MNNSEEFLTVKELAAKLKVNQMTIYRMVKANKLTYHKIGNAIRFKLSEIEKQTRIKPKKE